MNNMRKRNNNGGQRRHGGGHNGGGQRRYNNNSGGGNRSNGGDHQNLARQKHHATQMREKYMNHARDAQSNGDRVDVEYYLQHVDHYTRVLTDIGAIEAERHEKFREQQQQQPAHAGGEHGAHEASAEQPSAPENADVQASSTNEPISNSGNQPRMTRGPRHPSPRPDHNGAQAANANSDDIPLPGGVLDAI